MIQAILRRPHEGHAPQSSANPQGWQIGEGSPLIEHPMGHEIALGEQFTALEAEREHEKGSGHGGSNFGFVAFNNDNDNDEDQEGVHIDSPTPGAGPSVSTLCSLVLCLMHCLVLSYLVVFHVSPTSVSFSCPAGSNVDRRCM